MPLDLERIRVDAERTLDPEWVKKYGDEAWKAALVLLGEPPPSRRRQRLHRKASDRAESGAPLPCSGPDQEGNVGKVPLFLAKVPPDVEGRVKLVSDMYRSLTCKESTPEALAKARATFEATDEATMTQEAEEALVVVDDSNYINGHQRKPSGTGAWGFSAVDPSQPDYLNHVIWARGKFAEAKQKAVRIAAKRGVAKLWVCA